MSKPHRAEKKSIVISISNYNTITAFKKDTETYDQAFSRILEYADMGYAYEQRQEIEGDND